MAQTSDPHCSSSTAHLVPTLISPIDHRTRSTWMPYHKITNGIWILVLVLSLANSQRRCVHNRSFWRMLRVTHQTQFLSWRRNKIKADASLAPASVLSEGLPLIQLFQKVDYFDIRQESEHCLRRCDLPWADHGTLNGGRVKKNWGKTLRCTGLFVTSV